MDTSIVSRAMIEAKARSAFARGDGRAEHGFNPGAPAIEAWQDEWDRCEKVRRHIPVDALCTVRRSTPP